MNPSPFHPSAKLDLPNRPNFPVQIIRSAKRKMTYAIQVHADVVIVRAPIRATDHDITSLLESKREWIAEAQKRAAERQQLPTPIDNGQVWFLGEPFAVCTIPEMLDYWSVDLIESKLCVRGPKADRDPGAVKKAITAWYRQQANHRLPDRLRQLAREHGYHPNAIRVKEQKTRWGSCSAAGNINLNWRLVMAPAHVSDYVMIHELCHLREMNHSHRFWRLVGKAMPEYETSMKWLKNHADRLQW